MKPLFRLFAILLLSLPLLAAGKAFKGTSDYRDPKELNGFLNVKLDTYASMVKEPKGTDCDWVMVDPSFDLADLQKTTVEFSPDSITRNGGWDASYWGFYGGMRGLRRSVPRLWPALSMCRSRNSNTNWTDVNAPVWLC
jgi:hypothetical protein